MLSNWLRWLSGIRSWHVLLLLAGTSFISGWIGFALTVDTHDRWTDPPYQSLQLFFLNFEWPTSDAGGRLPQSLWLEFARFGAFATAIWTIIRGLFPQVRRMLKQITRRMSPDCAVILGYDATGQAIGQSLVRQPNGLRYLSAVTRGITPEMASRARADGTLLIEGAPGDARLLARIGAAKAKRIFVTGSTDLEAIDTAISVRALLGPAADDLRVILHDGAVATRMAGSSTEGFLGAPGLKWFSLADETARYLIATLRFDRFAVETGAHCQHLVIVGFGTQGEAIAAEALMTGWRTGLGPPRLTILDCNPSAAMARLRLRIPAAFPEEGQTPLPERARPDIRVEACQAEAFDLRPGGPLATYCAAATGWVFCTRDDGSNLQAALSLHEAMTAGRVAPAPIAIRLRGQGQSIPSQVLQPVAMARSFGGIDEVIERSHIVLPDPDALPRALHAAYDRAAMQMGLTSNTVPWNDLPETKRNANRALFRHAVMKIEDAGAEAQPPLIGIPVVDPGLAQRLRDVDSQLDYSRLDRSLNSDRWGRDGSTLSHDQARLALALRDAALSEHNRWVTERALNGFVPTSRPDATLRDDRARRHNNMHDWFDLSDPIIRRFDVVMLQALFDRTGDLTAQTARPERVRTLLLPHLSGDPRSEQILVGEPDATELRVLVSRSLASGDALAAILPLLRQSFPSDRRLAPRRLRFDFILPPEPSMLSLVNLLASAVRSFGPEDLMIEGLWAWRLGSGKTLGFVGHRSLQAFGGQDAVVRRLRPVLLDMVVRRGVRALVTGYAPGADQAAVHAWADLRLKPPRLIFPFAGTTQDGSPTYRTDAAAAPHPAGALNGLGIPTLPDSGTGHEAQAATVLARSDILLALVDPSHPGRSAGTQETVQAARQKGIEVIELHPV